MSIRSIHILLVRVIFSLIFILIPIVSYSQGKAKIKGRITDDTGTPLFPASVGIQGSAGGTVTNEKGTFELSVSANDSLLLVVSFLGYQDHEEIIILRNNEVRELDISLTTDLEILEDVEVVGIRQRENTLIPIDIRSIDQLPNSSGNIETIIKTLPGVASGNELSSQYSVRGGSFDENLIYVNDIEIHRPMLIHSAQQEGLSFVNPDMVSSIQFSAGGFDAEYGDKLSSVLDIRYHRPNEFGGSASASLLGGSAHVEGTTKNKRFSHNTGVRYKTTQFLLGTLDTRGDYSPSFTDLQTFLTYDIHEKLELSVLGNLSLNTFSKQPYRRITSFGTVQQTLTFDVFYEGQEKDRFLTYLGAAALNYKPSDKVSLKLIASGFSSDEEITFDLLKQYWLGFATYGSSGARDSLVNIGVGTSLTHARDYLSSNIYSLEHKGHGFTNSGIVKWGIKYQREIISDRINEWEMIDSAGYSLPYSDQEINLLDVYNVDNSLDNHRGTAYAQYSHNFEGEFGTIRFTIGARTQYWSFNKELTVSPRGNISFVPANHENINLHFAMGLYHQPPFYKEIRDRSGALYPERKAQRALHYVGGIDVNFQAWQRPFVFTAELYYKHMTRVIPYKLREVRLEYLPEFNAKAYAAGIDLRVYGEFVPGTESWFSLSVLQTKEDLYKDFIIQPNGAVDYPGYYRRPTDQLVSFAIFFQDYLPSNPDYKVHLLLNYGTGLPYSGPTTERHSVTYELGAYRRIDIGFSRLIARNTRTKYGVKSVWLSAEILNLLDASNKVSLDWVRTIESQYDLNVFYAVPNYLTGRIFNAKITANF